MAWMALAALLAGEVLVGGAAAQAPAVAEQAPDEVLAAGVRVRWSAAWPGKGTAEVGFVEAVASSAADLRAPSVAVARIKAERQARERAGERMRQALQGLPAARWSAGAPAAQALDAALKEAEASVEYESNGSVVVRLRLRLAALPGRLLPPDSVEHGRKERR